MSNRRKTRQQRTQRLDAGFSRMFRRSCSDCGGAQLVWMHGSDDLDLAQQMSPPDAAPHDVASADLWKCASCGNAGIFLPPDLY